jgi:hypothetical protein
MGCTEVEDLHYDEVDISKAWESIRGNIKASATENVGYCELKQHNLWFDKECSQLLDQKKQVKLQWLQAPSQTNGGKNNIKCETSRAFRNKKREYLKKKTN